MTPPTGRRRWRYLECPTCESNFRVEAGQPLPSHRRRRPGAMDVLEPCPAAPAAPATMTRVRPPRLPRLSATQLAALRAVLETGAGGFENRSGWHRGRYVKGEKVFLTGVGSFRWATGDALVDAGLLTVEVIGTNIRAYPTIIAHTVAAMLGDPS